MKLNVSVKKCKNCGEVFVVGYHASVGIQFWLTWLIWIGGIIYWAIRGGVERCPNCKSKDLDVTYKEMEV